MEIVHIQEIALRGETGLLLEDRDNEGRVTMFPWTVTVIAATESRSMR
jgi:hypothetical protein